MKIDKEEVPIERRKVNLNDKINFWTVIGIPFYLDSRRIAQYVLAKCICGTERETRIAHLLDGSTKSCGCKRNELQIITKGLCKTLAKDGTKTCNECQNKKDISEFSKQSNNIDKLSHQCKSCERERRLKQKFGIGHDYYEELLKSQDGLCPICSKQLVFIGNKVYNDIDHDHTTGKVRGVLCHNCNLMLGLAKDNTQTLLNAIHYLEKHRQDDE